jgi:predicted metal-binding membrane protein
MRYQSCVTPFAPPHPLSRLAAAESRVAALLAQPKRVALACIVVLSVFGWFALGLMAASSNLPGWQVLCRAGEAGGFGALALIAPMWAAMTLAMMLPTAGPMILTYAEIADTAARKREPAVSPLVLTAGYLAVWLGCALAASLLQMALARAGLLGGGRLATAFGGAIVLFAGLYQFSALKHACLTLCQRPFPFFFSNWTDEPIGVFRLGLRQGLYCLGCCWAMMLVMFAAGAMNVVWMAALGVVMAIEKMTTTARFSRIAGSGLVAVGVGLLAASVL